MTTLTEALELGLLNQCFLYLASNSPIYVGDRCPLITTSLNISSYGPKCLTGESLEMSVCLVSSKHPPLICCQLDYEEHHQSLEDTHTPTDSNHWQHSYVLQIISTIWSLSVPVFMSFYWDAITPWLVYSFWILKGELTFACGILSCSHAI